MLCIHHCDLFVGRKHRDVFFYLHWNVMSLHETEKLINPSLSRSALDKNKPALALTPTKAKAGAARTSLMVFENLSH